MMKALILAAGLGTRLRPHTLDRPKALFPIGGKPVLDLAIRRLAAAGCKAIGINTHHLGHQIHEYVSNQDYGIPIDIRDEPILLGTGGAIRNFSDFWDDAPFWVVNADIVTDIELADAWKAHCRHDPAATLVMHDRPEFNTVHVGEDGCIRALRPPLGSGSIDDHNLAFTGIQIVSPKMIDYLPPEGFASSITAYEHMIADGCSIRSWQPTGHYWQDIGAPGRYRQCAMDHLFSTVFGFPVSTVSKSQIHLDPIAGDGSDRRWFRATASSKTVILADHGLNAKPPTSEAQAFVTIGRHLHRKGVAVPPILAEEPVAGLVAVADFGNTHFQAAVRAESGSTSRLALYRPVLSALADLAFSGVIGFDKNWAWQTPALDKSVIVNQECRYFMRAFVRTVLPDLVTGAELLEEFNRLADQINASAIDGLVHRDCQSRNIMWRSDRIGFIDFQGARLGPVQYDVASLIIDPYAALSTIEQEQLADMAVAEYETHPGMDPDRFRLGLRYCALSRNLQILGAFGHLSLIKKKTEFAQYIPKALNTLDHCIRQLKAEFPALAHVVECIPRSGVWWHGKHDSSIDKEFT